MYSADMDESMGTPVQVTMGMHDVFEMASGSISTAAHPHATHTAPLPRMMDMQSVSLAQAGSPLPLASPEATSTHLGSTHETGAAWQGAATQMASDSSSSQPHRFTTRESIPIDMMDTPKSASAMPQSRSYHSISQTTGSPVQVEDVSNNTSSYPTDAQKEAEAAQTRDATELASISASSQPHQFTTRKSIVVDMRASSNSVSVVAQSRSYHSLAQSTGSPYEAQDAVDKRTYPEEAQEPVEAAQTGQSELASISASSHPQQFTARKSIVVDMMASPHSLSAMPHPRMSNHSIFEASSPCSSTASTVVTPQDSSVRQQPSATSMMSTSSHPVAISPAGRQSYYEMPSLSQTVHNNTDSAVYSNHNVYEDPLLEEEEEVDGAAAAAEVTPEEVPIYVDDFDAINENSKVSGQDADGGAVARSRALSSIQSKEDADLQYLSPPSEAVLAATAAVATDVYAPAQAHHEYGAAKVENPAEPHLTFYELYEKNRMPRVPRTQDKAVSCCHNDVGTQTDAESEDADDAGNTHSQSLVREEELTEAVEMLQVESIHTSPQRSATPNTYHNHLHHHNDREHTHTHNEDHYKYATHSGTSRRFVSGGGSSTSATSNGCIDKYPYYLSLLNQDKRDQAQEEMMYRRESGSYRERTPRTYSSKAVREKLRFFAFRNGNITRDASGVQQQQDDVPQVSDYDYYVSELNGGTPGANSSGFQMRRDLSPIASCPSWNASQRSVSRYGASRTSRRLGKSRSRSRSATSFKSLTQSERSKISRPTSQRSIAMDDRKSRTYPVLGVKATMFGGLRRHYRGGNTNSSRRQRPPKQHAAPLYASKGTHYNDRPSVPKYPRSTASRPLRPQQAAQLSPAISKSPQKKKPMKYEVLPPVLSDRPMAVTYHEEEEAAPMPYEPTRQGGASSSPQRTVSRGRSCRRSQRKPSASRRR